MKTENLILLPEGASVFGWLPVEEAAAKGGVPLAITQMDEDTFVAVAKLPPERYLRTTLEVRGATRAEVIELVRHRLAEMLDGV